jgi:hypothetical protein
MKKNKVIVTVGSEKFTLDIEDIFDDPFMEACTRIIEFKRQQSHHLSVPPCLIACLDRKGAKMHVYNTYMVLINAGFYVYAENLRDRFMKDSGIDLQKEPIKSK